MHKTTIYLPDDLRAAVQREARRREVAEAEVIRSAIEQVVRRPRPQAGLFESDEPIAGRVDELLTGFGER
ncbi:MAG: CopG family transcriptional regulator [Dermatophilaceae bacterium]